LELFVESDDVNPLHINYDFTKSEPLSIINDDDDEVEQKKKSGVGIKRHYKLKK